MLFELEEVPHDCGAQATAYALEVSALQASRTSVLVAVFSSSLGVGLIFGFQPPLIALTLSRMGFSSFAIGAVTAASLVAVILFGPVYPSVIARFGLKRSVCAGVCMAAALLLLMPLRLSVPVWLVLRFMAGCALGLSWIASEIWLNSVSGATTRGTVMGIYGAVFSSGIVAGPVLLEFTGTRGWPPYVIGAACLLLTLVPLAVLRNVAAPRSPVKSRNVITLLRCAPIVLLAAFVAGLVEAADLTLLPLFGIHAGFNERTALRLLTVFMIGNVALQLPIGMLADRFGRRLMLAVCAALSTLGPLLLRSSLGVPGVLWPLLFVWGGTLYAFYSQGIALLGEAFDASDLATANTLFVMIYCVGGIIGPSVGGIAMDAWPVQGLQVLLSAAAALMLSGLLFDRLRRR